jgi:hypothetical protein
MTRIASFVAAAVITSTACTAAAQLRAGLPIESLRAAVASSGLAVRDARVPGSADVPVRVALAREGAQDAQAIVDVWIAPTAAEARAWLADHGSTAMQAPLHERARGTFFADTASGSAGFAAIARDNVAAIVRSVDPAVDAAAIALAIDAAVAASPVGTPRPRSIPAPEVPADLEVGGSHPVQVPGDVVAVRVVATGDAYARRTPNGWMVTRTGAGAFEVHVEAVDALLRYVR